MFHRFRQTMDILFLVIGFLKTEETRTMKIAIEDIYNDKNNDDNGTETYVHTQEPRDRMKKKTNDQPYLTKDGRSLSCFCRWKLPFIEFKSQLIFRVRLNSVAHMHANARIRITLLVIHSLYFRVFCHALHFFFVRLHMPVLNIRVRLKYDIYIYIFRSYWSACNKIAKIKSQNELYRHVCIYIQVHCSFCRLIFILNVEMLDWSPFIFVSLSLSLFLSIASLLLKVIT